MTITATSKNDESITAQTYILVCNQDAKGYTKTVIDRVSFFVIHEQWENKRVLLYAADNVKTMAFGTTNVWRDSQVRSYLNSANSDGWLYGKARLQKKAQYVSVYTRTKEKSTTYFTTRDRVFLLGEEDIWGEFENTQVSPAVEHGFVAGQIVTIPYLDDSTTTNITINSWCRSPYNFSGNVLTLLGTQSTTSYVDCNQTAVVRPILWYKFDQD